jgi:hypothetical protein
MRKALYRQDRDLHTKVRGGGLTVSEQAIWQRSYEFWQREGCPNGLPAIYRFLLPAGALTLYGS